MAINPEGSEVLTLLSLYMSAGGITSVVTCPLLSDISKSQNEISAFTSQLVVPEAEDDKLFEELELGKSSNPTAELKIPLALLPSSNSGNIEKGLDSMLSINCLIMDPIGL